ncbi:MAG: deoxyribose-phosphate aldolase [Erysipelotrichaceae bacterium]|nr:deoxyribose-phosphate aldolase [Erysipelotrichaceae bacterium]
MNSQTITREELSRLFDHTNLKPNATDEDFKRLTDEAKQIHAAMVAINSAPVAYCHQLLKDTDIHVGAAIAFPLGQMTTASKLAEAKNAIDDGADEIDYVINVGDAIMHRYDAIRAEMEAMVELCHKHHKIIKVIFENCYLSKEEIKELALIAKAVKPDFIKTSTGFGTGGATVEDVRLMKETVGYEVGVKAAGGVRTWEQCANMIDAGATRIGTSSSFAILKGYDEAHQ